MLADRGIKWRRSPPRTPQSNGIAEKPIQRLMTVARSQIVKSGRSEKYWFFAVADAAFRTAGMPHEYLGGETPYERLTGQTFDYDRLRVWGADCFVQQRQQQRGAGSKFPPYARRGILVGHDRSSTSWYVWITQERKIVESFHVTFEREERVLGLIGETNQDVMEPSDEEDE